MHNSFSPEPQLRFVADAQAEVEVAQRVGRVVGERQRVGQEAGAALGLDPGLEDVLAARR